jgi:glycosyltransferase involved in cell wall biosynthesis
MMNDYLSKYPWLKGRVSLIPNTYDSELVPRYPVSLFDKFTITYAGGFYGNRQPHLFLSSLKTFLSDIDVKSEDVQVLFIGNSNRFVESAIRKLGLGSTVSCLGFIPYDQCIRYIFGSHLLLLIEFSQSVTTKVYDYLASGRSILALISEGELEQLITKYSSNSYIITSKKAQDITHAIKDCYARWKAGSSMNSIGGSKKFITDYSQWSLTCRLSTVLEGVLLSNRKCLNSSAKGADDMT